MSQPDRDPDCAVCQLNAGEKPIPGGVIFTNDMWLLRHNPPPYGLAGWMMLHTQRHVGGPADFTDAEAAIFGPALRHFRIDRPHDARAGEPQDKKQERHPDRRAKHVRQLPQRPQPDQPVYRQPEQSQKAAIGVLFAGKQPRQQAFGEEDEAGKGNRKLTDQGERMERVPATLRGGQRSGHPHRSCLSPHQ